MDQLVHATDILLSAQSAVAIPKNDIVRFVMNTLLDLMVDLVPRSLVDCHTRLFGQAVEHRIIDIPVVERTG